MQGGYASTFQLTLGGMFGDGPAFQDRATVALNNAFRNGDSLFGFRLEYDRCALGDPQLAGRNLL